MIQAAMKNKRVLQAALADPAGVAQTHSDSGGERASR